MEKYMETKTADNNNNNRQQQATKKTTTTTVNSPRLSKMLKHKSINRNLCNFYQLVTLYVGKKLFTCIRCGSLSNTSDNNNMINIPFSDTNFCIKYLLSTTSLTMVWQGDRGRRGMI